jgi:glycosyltransferase involved in cell wall biosynthesis
VKRVEKGAKALYICYFGVLEPLVQTQVIPYLRELVKGGHEISLVTFEGQIAELESYGVEKLRKELAQQGIDWYWLKYHKRFSAVATAYDVFRGTIFVLRMIGRKQLDILHGRVHVPTLMGALARKLSRRKPKLLFDIRGFFPEEYADAGVWPENGLLYRSAKRVERWLLKVSDGFVVLTEKARDILFPESDKTGYDKQGRPVEVIPCCVDFEKRFSVSDRLERGQTRSKLGLDGRFTISHVGALGGLYLQNEIADFLAAAKSVDPSVFSIVLTQSAPELILPLLKERGFGDSDFVVKKVPASEVPRYLEASDLGLSFVKASFSTLSRSPTKIPEYLACGLPIVANRGVGDVDMLIDSSRVGAVADHFTKADYIAAFQKIKQLGPVSEHCRDVAKQKFDLGRVGGDRYRRIYNRLLERQDDR